MRFVGVDPATVTGFVALDEQGEVLEEMIIKGKGSEEIQRMVDQQNLLFKLLMPNDEIVIEDAAMGTQKGVTTGMIHGGLRSMIYRKGLAFNLVNPLSVKKYVGVTGWTGDAGNKRRLTGPEKKSFVKQAVIKHFGYTHKNDNIVDAYIMARIAFNLYLTRDLFEVKDTQPYQIEVIESILSKVTS